MKHDLMRALAETFERSRAGRTGQAARAFGIPLEKLLQAAGCSDGARRVAALQTLAGIDGSLVALRRAHRDPATVTHVEFDPARETELYAQLGGAPPTERRQALSELFAAAARREAPGEYRADWRDACEKLAIAAASGAALAPFPRDLEQAGRLLDAAHGLLNWRGESLARFASCVLFGDSKTLDNLRGPIERILAVVTRDRVTTLRDVGILDNPRACAIRGPVSFHFPGGTLDLRLLRAPAALSLVDLRRCGRIELHTPRVCTVENPATFHELAKLNEPGALLACTEGYAGSAIIELIRRLPGDAEIHHFGDTDPAGFDILRDLRARTGRVVGSIHMQHHPAAEPVPLSDADHLILDRLLGRSEWPFSEQTTLHAMKRSGDKGRFEQEQLGPPRLPVWPYYE